MKAVYDAIGGPESLNSSTRDVANPRDGELSLCFSRVRGLATGVALRPMYCCGLVCTWVFQNFALFRLGRLYCGVVERRRGSVVSRP